MQIATRQRTNARNAVASKVLLNSMPGGKQRRIWRFDPRVRLPDPRSAPFDQIAVRVIVITKCRGIHIPLGVLASAPMQDRAEKALSNKGRHTQRPRPC